MTFWINRTLGLPDGVRGRRANRLAAKLVDGLTFGPFKRKPPRRKSARLHATKTAVEAPRA
jgi:hypothetical protein